MTAIDGTYTILVDTRGVLRVQMHGAPRPIRVGGLAEVKSSGEVIFVPAGRLSSSASNPPVDDPPA